MTVSFARRSGAAVAAAVLFVLFALTGCGSSAGPGSATITVFAASSLQGAFTQLGEHFERAKPNVRLRFNFAGSSALAMQIEEGAHADLFASASVQDMRRLSRSATTAGASNFAKNDLQIAVPADNPAHIKRISDLRDSHAKVALCQPEVPCGALAQQMFHKAGITVKPVTLESDVKATLSKLILGEADAAIVYKSDVVAAGDRVRAVKIPAAVIATAEYPIAVLKRTDNPAAARAFVDFVLSAEGQEVLAKWGFAKP
jgi:molybdate transport system substrate-binding protein